MLVRRSNLIVPVVKEKFVEKSWQRNADAITLDMEDGVAPDMKDTARKCVKDAIRTANLGGADVLVRVNNIPGMLEEDLDACVWPGLRGLAVPKIEDPDNIYLLEELLDKLEAERGIEKGSIKTTLAFESAYGYLHMNELVPLCKRAESMGLGKEDFTNDVGITSNDPMALFNPMMNIVITARAFNLHPRGVMGKVSSYKDLDGLSVIAKQAYEYGFRGAACVHPGQVEVLNNAYRPAEDKVKYAFRVVEAFQEALRQGVGAIGLDGKMVDKPVAERAQKVLDMHNEIEAFQEKKNKVFADNA